MMKKQKNYKQTISIIEKLTDMPYPMLFALWLVISFSFGAIYFIMATYIPEHAPTQIVRLSTDSGRLFNSIYYSVSTATTIGFGDITPRGFSKIISCLQSIMALVVFAIFITKLVSKKQEIALDQIHKLTFEDVFHDIKNGLYIVRKDFDYLIGIVKEQHEISEQKWRMLVAAYDQLQSFIQDIPNFYEVNNQFYTIDERREGILLEAVHRTLDRLHEMLHIFNNENIPWHLFERSKQELEIVLILTKKVTHLWKKSSPYHHSELFAEIMNEQQKIVDLLHQKTIVT